VETGLQKSIGQTVYATKAFALRVRNAMSVQVIDTSAVLSMDESGAATSKATCRKLKCEHPVSTKSEGVNVWITNIS
jgi:hypothetical protein